MCDSLLPQLLRRGLATAAKHEGAAVNKAPGTESSRKKENVFDVARLRPGWGVGGNFVKSHWKPHTHYKLCDVKPRKVWKQVNNKGQTSGVGSTLKMDLIGSGGISLAPRIVRAFNQSME